MPVRAIATANRCKICRHPRRAEIDSLIELRSNRTVLEDGTKVNLDYVLKQLADKFEITNPTRENVTVHWQKHCELIAQETADAVEERHNEIVERYESGERVSPDEALEFIIYHGFEDAKAKLLESGKAGITIDQVLKAVDAKTRRKHDESANQLLRAAAGGIQLAMQRAFGGDEQPALEGAAELVEDAELLPPDPPEREATVAP